MQLPLRAVVLRAQDHTLQQGQPQGTVQHKLPQSLRNMISELRAADAASVVPCLKSLVALEREAAAKLRNRIAEPSMREEALKEIEEVDLALATTIRQALPSGRADEDAVAQVLAPWIETWLVKPLDVAMNSRLGRLASDCKEIQHSILLVAPNDSPENVKMKQAAVEAWKAAREEAVRLILDTAKYPDADHGRIAQPRVDECSKLVWDSYKSLEGLLEVDLRNLLKRKPEQWAAQLEQLAAGCNVLEASRELLKARPAIKVSDPTTEAASAKRMMLAKGLVQAFAGNREASRASLAAGGPYFAELQRRAAAQLVFDFNQQAFERLKSSMGAVEYKVVVCMNEYRLAMGVVPLEIEEQLFACAKGHSQEMSDLDYYSHESPTPEKKTFFDRAKLAGYPSANVGECICKASKESSGRKVFLIWYNSSTHHRLMLSEGFRQAGVGRFGPYFTANFGSEHTLGD